MASIWKLKSAFVERKKNPYQTGNISIEGQLQSGQSNDAQNQQYLAKKIVELQQQIKDIQTQ